MISTAVLFGVNFVTFARIGTKRARPAYFLYDSIVLIG